MLTDRLDVKKIAGFETDWQVLADRADINVYTDWIGMTGSERSSPLAAKP